MNKYSIYTYFQNNKEKILYINNLINNGFITTEIVKYPNLLGKLKEIEQTQKNTINEIEVLYSNFMENIYKNILDETYEYPQATFIHLHHPELYLYIDYVENKIEEFVNEINTLYAGNYIYTYDDIIKTPFFYVYGEFDYGDITKICINKKVNLYDLERCIYDYYLTYKRLCYTHLSIFKRYTFDKYSTPYEEIDKIKEVENRFVMMLMDENTFNNVNNIISKFYTDLLNIKEKILDYLSDIDIIYTRTNIYIDEALTEIMQYKYMSFITIYDFEDIYNNLDNMKSTYEKRYNYIYEHFKKIDALCNKWRKIYNKFSDEYQYLLKMLV